MYTIFVSYFPTNHLHNIFLVVQFSPVVKVGDQFLLLVSRSRISKWLRKWRSVVLAAAALVQWWFIDLKVGNSVSD